MEKLEIWDADFQAGLTFESGKAWVREDEVIDVLNRCGIERSIVSTSRLGPDGWAEANMRISQMVENGQGRLVGAYISPMNCYRENESLAGYAEEIVRRGAMCIRLIPETGPQASPVVLSKHCAVMDAIEVYSEYKIPLLVSVGHFSGEDSRYRYGLEAIIRLANDFPDTPFVLTHGHYRAMCQLEELLKRCSNSYLTISGLGLFYQLESLVRRFGQNRFLFGSSAPQMDPAMGVGMLAWSRMSDEKKYRIGSQNLRELLGY